MKRKFLALINILVALAFVLAACGAPEPQEGTEAPAATESLPGTGATVTAITVTQEPMATDAMGTAGVMETPEAGGTANATAAATAAGGGIQATVGASAATQAAGGTAAATEAPATAGTPAAGGTAAATGAAETPDATSAGTPAAGSTPAAGGTQPAPAATQPPVTAIPGEPYVAAGTVPEGALVSLAVDAAPTLDGMGDEAAWGEAEAVTISVTGGGNQSNTQVSIKSVYSGDQVYFLVTWADPTQSFVRSPWEFQADGTWKKLIDPQDQGGDNNLYYEDKFSMIWPIANSIPGFDAQGCFTACHAGENSDVKPYGNKYTRAPGQMGDIWHWKSVRNLNQVDDQYLDHMPYSADSPEAGRHSDPRTGGGYVDNQTEDRSGPAFMAPNGGSKADGAPGYILDSEKVAIDPSLFAAGDLVPGVIISEIEGDRGSITAGWQYAGGQWTLEFGRPMTTGSPYDVQFDDLAGVYFFGVAVFDNVQVRHAFQAGATAFVFQPR